MDKTPFSREEDVDSLTQELESEAMRLRHFSHGVEMGVSEIGDMAQNHPNLLEFFESADEVLDLNEGQRKELFNLEKRYLDGKITDAEFNDLKERYFKPYFARIEKDHGKK